MIPFTVISYKNCPPLKHNVLHFIRTWTARSVVTFTVNRCGLNGRSSVPGRDRDILFATTSTRPDLIQGSRMRGAAMTMPPLQLDCVSQGQP